MLALTHFWLPAVETQVSFFRSFGVMHPAHLILAVCDTLLAVVLGLSVGFLIGRLTRLRPMVFAVAFATGLAVGLVVTRTVEGGSDTVIWLLRQVGFWTLPIAVWLGTALASRKKPLQSAA